MLSESSRNGDVNGSRSRRGVEEREKEEKGKIWKEKDGGAEGEGDGEEAHDGETREWMRSHYALCSFNFFKGPSPATPRRSLRSLHPLTLDCRINKASTM